MTSNPISVPDLKWIYAKFVRGNREITRNSEPEEAVDANKGDAEEATRTQAIEQRSEMIVENDIALLVTHGSDHVTRSRPIINFNSHLDGDLHFLTEAQGELVQLFRAKPRCSVSIPEPAKRRYVSITGTAIAGNDAKRAALLRTHSCCRWFGLDEPKKSILIIKVDVDDPEIGIKTSR